MMDHALAQGLSVFDTAAAYGGGASETVVGQWLRDRGTREKVTLLTKLLPPYTPASIVESVAHSLRRLGVTTIDVLFLHRWDDTVMNPGTLEALDEQVRSGRVGALAASNFTVSQLSLTLERQKAAGLAPMRALQNIHNYAVRGIDEETRTVCQSADIGIMTYSPLGAGFLTGKYADGIPPGTRFDVIPGHQRIYFHPEAQQRLARLHDIARKAGLPVPEVAIGWALRQPGIATVLVGGRTPEQLDQALRAQSLVTHPAIAELDE